MQIPKLHYIQKEPSGNIKNLNGQKLLRHGKW